LLQHYEIQTGFEDLSSNPVFYKFLKFIISAGKADIYQEY